MTKKQYIKTKGRHVKYMEKMLKNRMEQYEKLERKLKGLEEERRIKTE